MKCRVLNDLRKRRYNRLTGEIKREIAAVVFGGGKLAGVGKALGKSVREFKEEIKDNNNDSDESVDK